jgi:hypothetical protein
MDLSQSIIGIINSRLEKKGSAWEETQVYSKQHGCVLLLYSAISEYRLAIAIATAVRAVGIVKA